MHFEIGTYYLWQGIRNFPNDKIIRTNATLSLYYVHRVEIEESFAVNLSSGHTIHAGPPPGSGIILAYILRILDGILPAPNAGLDAQRLVEAFKFGYGERTHLGDHEFVNVSRVWTATPWMCCTRMRYKLKPIDFFSSDLRNRKKR